MDFSLSRTDEAIGGRGLAGGRSLSQTFDSQWLQWRLRGGGLLLRCKKPNAKCVKAGESGSLATTRPPPPHLKRTSKTGQKQIDAHGGCFF